MGTWTGAAGTCAPPVREPSTSLALGLLEDSGGTDRHGDKVQATLRREVLVLCNMSGVNLQCFSSIIALRLSKASGQQSTSALLRRYNNLTQTSSGSG